MRRLRLDETLSPHDEARRAVRLASILTLLLCAAGIAGLRVVAKYELWRRSIFYEQFAAIEPPAIALLAAFALAVLVLTMRTGAVTSAVVDTPVAPFSRRLQFAIAAGALLITAVGTWVVFHGYPFVDDEFSGVFQSIIYSSGDRVAVVADPWCRWIGALTPTSIAVPAPCTWQLGYFPVNALIRGIFDVIRAGSFANPVMTALSVVLIYDASRRAWPERPDRAALAALFLACSTQVLLMSMSAFSMPAHLLASTLWLWLYVQPERRWTLIALPWVGVIALGVHSPYPHVLFVAPLVLSFLFQRRFAAFAYVSIVYVIGALAWVGRLYPDGESVAAPTASAERIVATAGSMATSPAGDPMTASMSTTVLATWNVPIALLCVLTALLLWNRLDRFARWVAVSLLFTVVVRAFISGTYGAGWGHRYAYAALANLAMLAAIGTDALRDAFGRRTAYRLVTAAFVVALAIQLPMRAVQAGRIVRPYYEATKYMESLPADVVIVHFETLQWGRQLLRNDPYLRNTPKLMSYPELGQTGIDSLEAMFPGRVKVVAPGELEAFGIRRATRIGRFEIR